MKINKARYYVVCDFTMFRGDWVFRVFTSKYDVTWFGERWIEAHPHGAYWVCSAKPFYQYIKDNRKWLKQHRLDVAKL